VTEESICVERLKKTCGDMEPIKKIMMCLNLGYEKSGKAINK